VKLQRLEELRIRRWYFDRSACLPNYTASQPR